MEVIKEYTTVSNCNFCHIHSITTHLLSIERAYCLKLHDMFKARDANVWQREFPVGFPVEVSALNSLFINANILTLKWISNSDGISEATNTLRSRQDGRHFADDIFMCNFFNENCCILIKFSLKYVRKGPIDIDPTLVQIMAWRRSGDKPLSEPMMISLPTHICVTRPQWVNDNNWKGFRYIWPRFQFILAMYCVYMGRIMWEIIRKDR